MENQNDHNDGFFSLQQLLDIEGLHDEVEIHNMGLELDSSDDENEASTNRQQLSNEDNREQAWQHVGENSTEVNHRSKPNLTDEIRRALVDDLLEMEKEGNLPWGAKRKIADKYNVSRFTVERIWKRAKRCRRDGIPINVNSKKPGNCGRKPVEYTDEWLQSVPLHLRTNVRAFAGYLKVAPSTVYRLLKKGRLRSHTSSNHPSVSVKHKLDRMKWVLSHILPATTEEPPTFVNMHNVIHIDEKWFYFNPDMRRFYLLPREDDPYRCCQSKRFKIKAMFMAATSRPIHDSEGKLIHDGKFGIFPFTENHIAKHSNKNRPAGTVETKAIHNVTQDVIRDMIINNVLPSIMRNWSAGLSKDIYIQQDNVRPHIHPDDPEFIEAAKQNGFNIKLVYQPAQSPDLNVLDLGFFRAILAIQYQSFPKTLDDLILRVQDAYDFFDPEVLKYTWLQLQYVMVEILKVNGNNNYKNPHHGKRRLERLGLLPKNVQVDQQIIDDAVKFLNENATYICRPTNGFL